jgi:bifunctional DNA-binding transcriptional regulator/antitoxin component of YhaV-PrlF toxin-antitoxin module
MELKGLALFGYTPLPPPLVLAVCVLGCFSCSACKMRFSHVFLSREKSYKVPLRQPHVEAQALPLTENVTFKTRLQTGNRVQVPKPIRNRYTIDSSQILIVDVRVLGAHSKWETFYVSMDKSGRITIPKLTLNLLQGGASEQGLAGLIFEVNIEPA